MLALAVEVEPFDGREHVSAIALQPFLSRS